MCIRSSIVKMSMYHELRCDCNPNKLLPYCNERSFETHFYSHRHKAYEYDKLLPEHHRLQVRFDIGTRQRDVALARAERLEMQNRILQRQNDSLQTEIQAERRMREEAIQDKNRLMSIISGIQNVITTQHS